MNGKVYLIGAGPGDPGLITVKALDCIKNSYFETCPCGG